MFNMSLGSRDDMLMTMYQYQYDHVTRLDQLR